MFHPDAMLKIGHDREAELIRDAQTSGVPQTEGAGRLALAPAAQLLVVLAVVAPVLFLLARVVFAS